MASYLFYSPQLESVNVPQHQQPNLQNGGPLQNSPQLGPMHNSPLDGSSLQLTPNYGPSTYFGGPPTNQHQQENDLLNPQFYYTSPYPQFVSPAGAMPTSPMFFVNSPNHYPQNEPNRPRPFELSETGFAGVNPHSHSTYDSRQNQGPQRHIAHFQSNMPQQNHHSQIFDNIQPRNNSLTEIINHNMVADLATDQNGSRFIQTKLESATPQEKQAVFEQILPETLRLCTDVFGNYCIQKFFEHGTPEQKTALARKVKGKVLTLALQMYGCRVVQKILESVDVSTQKILIEELDGHVLDCVKDQNANHVIQKCIERVSAERIDFIVKAFHGRVYDLSTHPYGCRVIQRMLEHLEEKACDSILKELCKYVELLAKDQYGNYVLQHVLQHYNGHSEIKMEIIRVAAKNILSFSKHKFASNVVERCFVCASKKQKQILLDAVVGTAESSPLVSMVRDQYANYVIQKMLETLVSDQRAQLIDKIGKYVPNIRKIAFGKHIVTKIEKLTGKFEQEPS